MLAVSRNTIISKYEFPDEGLKLRERERERGINRPFEVEEFVAFQWKKESQGGSHTEKR